MSLHLPAFEAALRAHSADATVTCRLEFLTHASADLPAGLHRATTVDLERLMGRQHWQAWTRYTYDNHLRAYFRWALSRGLRADDPMTLIPRPPQGPKVPRPITELELQLLLSRTPHPWPLVWLLASYGGLRASEIAGLNRSDVAEESMRILGKGGKVRVVPTHPCVWAAVADLPPGPVVLDRLGRPMTGRQLSVRASSMMRRLGLHGIHIHRGRHRFATKVYEQTGDIAVVQQLLGHASIATTMNYTLVDASRLRSAVQALPAVEHRAAVTRPVPAQHAGRAA